MTGILSLIFSYLKQRESIQLQTLCKKYYFTKIPTIIGIVWSEWSVTNHHLRMLAEEKALQNMQAFELVLKKRGALKPFVYGR